MKIMRKVTRELLDRKTARQKIKIRRREKMKQKEKKRK